MCEARSLAEGLVASKELWISRRTGICNSNEEETDTEGRINLIKVRIRINFRLPLNKINGYLVFHPELLYHYYCAIVFRFWKMLSCGAFKKSLWPCVLPFLSCCELTKACLFAYIFQTMERSPRCRFWSSATHSTADTVASSRDSSRWQTNGSRWVSVILFSLLRILPGSFVLVDNQVTSVFIPCSRWESNFRLEIPLLEPAQMSLRSEIEMHKVVRPLETDTRICHQFLL